MANRKYWEGFETVKHTKNFAVLHKTDSDPFNEKDSAFYLVNKKYSTVEAEGKSCIMLMEFLEQAEEAFLSIEKPDKQVEKAPTIQ